MKLELKKFDPGRIKSDSVVVFIGKRNTGKSYCMKDILRMVAPPQLLLVFRARSVERGAGTGSIIEYLFFEAHPLSKRGSVLIKSG